MWTTLIAGIARAVPWGKLAAWFPAIALYFKGGADASARDKLRRAEAHVEADKQGDEIRRDTGRMSDAELDRELRKHVRGGEN
jgi:hypothetical protein